MYGSRSGNLEAAQDQYLSRQANEVDVDADRDLDRLCKKVAYCDERIHDINRILSNFTERLYGPLPPMPTKAENTKISMAVGRVTDLEILIDSLHETLGQTFERINRISRL